MSSKPKRFRCCWTDIRRGPWHHGWDPEFAEALEPTLKVLADLHRVAVDRRSASHNTVSVGTPERVEGCILGDIRILREIGRGGMGVVYEAEQISLQRRVAVKVLPFAAAFDSHRLQRFRKEVLAVASLVHPNIVSIYSVGTERGVHFYVMQFVEGRTLGEVIAELRERDRTTSEVSDLQSGESPVAAGPQTPPSEEPPEGSLGLPRSGPAFARWVAELGLQAAGALDHAHRAGILHRDVKPSNLILDANGHLWVSDFGLATTSGQPDVTLTGDVVGTLRYMSPEQAAGRRQDIDHRTDLYSLGVTLYELATLEQAFPGHDSHQLMRRVIESDPPQEHFSNGGIPKDLQAIVLKAMAKKPGDRYETAADLADDLARFLRSEPTQAKVPSRMQRVCGWCARRRTAVVIALFTALLLGTAASLFVWHSWRDQVHQRRLVESEFESARETIRVLLSTIGEGHPEPAPKDDPQTRNRLQTALDHFQRCAADHERAGGSRLELLLLHCDMGRILAVLDQQPESEAAFREAVVLGEALVEEEEDNVRYRNGLGTALVGLADILAKRNRVTEAQKTFRRALEIRRSLAKEFPDQAAYHSDLAATLNNLALSENRVVARELLQQAIASQTIAVEQSPGEFRYQRYLRNHYSNLAECLKSNGADQTRDAIEACENAVHWANELVRDRPDAAGDLRKLAERYDQLQLLLASSPDRASEAITWINKMAEVYQQLADTHPHVKWYRHALGHTWAKAAAYHDAEAQFESMIENLEKAVECFEASLLEDSDDHPSQNCLALGLNNLAWLLVTCPDSQFWDPPRAVEHAERAVDLAPDAASNWNTLGVALYRTEKFEESIEALEKSMELTSGGTSMDWFFLAMVRWRLSEPEVARDWFERAVQWMEKNQPDDDELLRFRAEAVSLLGVEDAGDSRNPEDDPGDEDV